MNKKILYFTNFLSFFLSCAEKATLIESNSKSLDHLEIPNELKNFSQVLSEKQEENPNSNFFAFFISNLGSTINNLKGGNVDSSVLGYAWKDINIDQNFLTGNFETKKAAYQKVLEQLQKEMNEIVTLPQEKQLLPTLKAFNHFFKQGHQVAQQAHHEIQKRVQAACANLEFYFNGEKVSLSPQETQFNLVGIKANENSPVGISREFDYVVNSNFEAKLKNKQTNQLIKVLIAERRDPKKYDLYEAILGANSQQLDSPIYVTNSVNKNLKLENFQTLQSETMFHLGSSFQDLHNNEIFQNLFVGDFIYNFDFFEKMESFEEGSETELQKVFETEGFKMENFVPIHHAAYCKGNLSLPSKSVDALIFIVDTIDNHSTTSQENQNSSPQQNQNSSPQQNQNVW